MIAGRSLVGSPISVKYWHYRRAEAWDGALETGVA